MDLAAVIGTAIAVVLGVVLLALVLALLALPFALLAMLVRRSPTPSPPAHAPVPWTDDDEIAARHHR